MKRTAIAAAVLESGSDVFAKIRITVDASKTVQPIAQSSSEAQPASAMKSTHEVLKYKTISKYTYYESGDKWVKVLLSDLAGLDKHPKDKLKVDFQNRSFTVKVDDFKGENLQFTVPRLQCRILPQACTLSHKSSGLQINLRKKNTTDNWYSLFKSKAIGEKDTDEEDALADEEAKKRS